MVTYLHQVRIIGCNVFCSCLTVSCAKATLPQIISKHTMNHWHATIVHISGMVWWNMWPWFWPHPWLLFFNYQWQQQAIYRIVIVPVTWTSLSVFRERPLNLILYSLARLSKLNTDMCLIPFDIHHRLCIVYASRYGWNQDMCITIRILMLCVSRFWSTSESLQPYQIVCLLISVQFMYIIIMLKAKNWKMSNSKIICRRTNSSHISIETPLSSLKLKSHRRWAFSAAISCVP